MKYEMVINPGKFDAHTASSFGRVKIDGQTELRFIIQMKPDAQHPSRVAIK